MDGFQIYSKFHGKLELQAGLPDRFNERIPGAECAFIAHQHMSMVFQKVKVGNYDVVLSHYKGMSLNDRFSCEDDQPVIELNFNLTGKARIDLTNNDWVIYQPEYHELMILPYVKDKVHFLTYELENFGIHIPFDQFQKLAKKLTHLKPLQKAYVNKTFGFLNKKIPIKTSIKSMALLVQIKERIIAGLNDELTLKLLEQLIEEALSCGQEVLSDGKQKFSYIDVKGIIDFELLLQSDLCEPIKINSLIAKSHMNPRKLRQGFKLLYDSSLYDYRLSLVYRYIFEQMKSSNFTNLNEFVAMSNTKNVTDFAKLFQRYIGIDPRILLKKA